MRPPVADTMTLPLTLDRDAALRRGRLLNAISLAYNSAESIIAIAAGLAAGSIALVGFGFDSAIEVSATLAATWRLAADGNAVARDRVERLALRFIGATFLVLAAYVAVESTTALIERAHPEVSPLGLALAIVSVTLMPFLARAKKAVARRLDSGALAAEAQQTALCSWLSAILLAGLGLNALFGWWWADAVAALGMVPIIAKEGWAGVRGISDCGCGHAH
jgi:divalent metal cation (Fe/Co/Zn/Cd) transporter